MTPLVVYRSFLYPFEIPRIIFFRTTVIAALLIFFWIRAGNESLQCRIKNPITIALLCFSVSTLFSTVWSSVPYQSFWGTLSRGGGLVTFVFVFACYFLYGAFCRTEQLWQRVFLLGSVVSGLVSVYALLQRLGLGVYDTGVFRVTGTIGNAALLSGFLLFGLALSLLVFVKSKVYVYRIVAALIIFLNGAALLFAQTRGTLLGLVFGIVLASIIFISFANWSRIQRLVGVGAICIGLLGILALLPSVNQATTGTFFARVFEINLSDRTLQTRLFAWRAGLDAWQDRSILGWGIENFEIAYQTRFDPAFYLLARGETGFDRAHNIVVELLVTQGIVGLVSYTAWIGTLVWAVIRLCRRKQMHRTEAAILVGLFGAYVIHNLLVFDSTNSFLFFVIVSAYIAWRYTALQEQQPILTWHTPRFVWTIACIFVLLVGGFFTLFHIRLLFRAHSAAQVYDALSKGYDQEAIPHILAAVQSGHPWQADVMVDLTKPILDTGRSTNGTVQQELFASMPMLDVAMQQVAPHIEQDARNLERLGRVYSLWYELDSSATHAFETSQHFFEKSHGLSPNNLTTVMSHAHLLSLNNQHAKGLELLQAAQMPTPLIPELYWSEAILLSKLSRQDEMVLAMKKAVLLGYQFISIEALTEALPIFQALEEPAFLVQLYVQATTLEPENPAWYAMLAAAYKEKGDSASARATGEYIIAQWPEYQEQTQDFLNTL